MSKNRWGKFIVKSILYAACFVTLLGINSGKYLLECWGDINFATVIYQLNSPLKGTNQDVVLQYIEIAIVPTIILYLGIILLWKCIKLLFSKIQLTITGQFIGYNFGFKCKLAKRVNVYENILLVSIVMLLIVRLYSMSLEVGIIDYIGEVTQSSSIFEEEYVDPETVDICFEDKRNLIYIYLESMENTYADIESGGAKNINYIPNLMKLANDNISFSDTNDFGGLFRSAGTEWTMGALLGGATGVPYKLPIEGNSAGEYEKFLPGIVSIGEILEENGYNNYFMCGSDATFGGRKLFFEQHGNYEIIDYYTAIEEGIIPEEYYEFWGLEDCKLYEYSKKKLQEIATQGEPFNFTMLTVDTHHSDGYICEKCEKLYQEQYANAISCADKQINEFIKWIQGQTWYDNTVVIISGDHTSMNKSFFEKLPENFERRIYNCIINANMEPGLGETNRNASILDMMPTTLALMGANIEGERLGLGTNLFSTKQTLAEEMGMDVFNRELSKYSKYYNEKFIIGN